MAGVLGFRRKMLKATYNQKGFKNSLLMRSEGTIILQGVTLDQLQDLIRNTVSQEVAKIAPVEKEELLSPKLARQVWQPAISLVTLNAWTKQGLLKPHYFGKKLFYKRSEIIAAAQVLLPYKTKNR